VANFLSQTDEQGIRRVLGETISHSGYIIMILQIPVSRIIERFKPMPTFSFGLFIAAAGYILLGFARTSVSTWAFLGIFLFAVGEMASSPRIQEYITWIAPKEKAGLYMGTNFLSMLIGAALSGVLYTSLYGYFRAQGNPEYIWYVLACHLVLGIILMFLFTRFIGVFKELDE
jgi:dipeptide/tripeptide permease